MSKLPPELVPKLVMLKAIQRHYQSGLVGTTTPEKDEAIARDSMLAAYRDVLNEGFNDDDPDAFVVRRIAALES